MKPVIATPLCALLLGSLPVAALGAVTVVQQDGIEYVQEWEHLDDQEGSFIKQMTTDLISNIDAGAKKRADKRVLRDAHPKAHGCVVAKFTVDADLPADMQTGVLQPGKTYDALIRLSSASATPQDDGKGDARGMAIKLFGVSGPKLAPGPVDATTQDFVMINFPIFPAHNAADFGGLVGAIVAGNPVKYFFPSIDPSTWKVQQAAALAAFNGKSDASMLQQRFFSLVPALINDQPIKYGAVPCSNDPATRPDNPGANFLREELQGFLGKNPGCFDFVVQKHQPEFEIEDGMGWWPAGLSADVEPHIVLAGVSGLKATSPFSKVAHIVIPPQNFDTPAKNTYCDNLSFTPWHTIAAHRPLGGINRARRAIYQAISDHRHQANSATPAEPVSSNDYQNLK